MAFRAFRNSAHVRRENWERKDDKQWISGDTNHDSGNECRQAGPDWGKNMVANKVAKIGSDVLFATRS